MTRHTLGDWPDLRGVPDCDPADCIPSLARKPHNHQLLCDAWRRNLIRIEHGRILPPTLPRSF